MDDLLREAKERFLLEGQKAYIAINAGGAVALLAFLQAIWEKCPDTTLIKGVLYGIIAFAIGVTIAVASFPIRHYALNQQAFAKEETGSFSWPTGTCRVRQSYVFWLDYYYR